MRRFLIEEVKCGVADTCPMVGLVITSIKYNDGEGSKWLNLSELDGYPCFSLTNRDVFDELMENDFIEEFQAEMNKSFTNEFNGLTLGEYDDIFDCIYDGNEDNPTTAFLRYVIAVTRADFDVVDRLKKMAIGKYADELEFDMSDVEDEYLYDRSFDEEDDD